MEAPKDKRTKAYKEWVKNHQKASEGLGDTVEKITKATGIKKAVEMFADGKDCGCDERKEKLNKMFRYSKPNCLNEDEFELIRIAVETRKNKFTSADQETYKAIYERVFDKKVECTSCSFRNEIWKDLFRMYNEYLG